ncbi:prestin-like isoform X2 [Lethenteron reissneri]|uniref:prestin-like isoform X2 n=1 Tax=Lethenteron reissneri TaxID=7753 RepID=UPI002AB66BD1|nr:prestin-like isoform X2 [Lethenteron reissneri]
MLRYSAGVNVLRIIYLQELRIWIDHWRPLAVAWTPTRGARRAAVEKHRGALFRSEINNLTTVVTHTHNKKRQRINNAGALTRRARMERMDSHATSQTLPQKTPVPALPAYAASTMIHVERPIYREHVLKKSFGGGRDSSGAQLLGRLAGLFACSWRGALGLLCRRMPILDWLPKYKVKQWLLGDIISGLTVGIVHIPQGMAYAFLAALPPIYGLYTSFFPVLIYVMAGTSRHTSMGTFAIVSLMTGGVVERFASNVTAIDPQELESQKISIATTLAVLSGAIQLIMFSLQLGFVAIYLSDPLVSAFTNAAAIHVLVSQIKNMLGLQVPRFSGPASIFMTMVDIFQKLPNTNIAELVTSLVCLTVLIPVREINQRYKSKLKAPIPVELLLIILATVISFYARLEEKFGVTVVGNIPAGLPVPQLPTVTNFSSLIADGLAIAIVGYAVSVSLAKIFAKKHGYTVDANQELFAHGVCNLFGSFFQCFPSAASISRTSIQEGTGGNTQLASGISTMVVLVVLLAVGPLFRALQRSVLACIIVVGLKRMLMHFTDLKQLWKISKVDFYIWLVTWLAVLLLNVDLGLGVAVAFSLMTIVYRTQRPDCKLLGRIPNTELYRPLDEFAKREGPLAVDRPVRQSRSDLDEREDLGVGLLHVRVAAHDLEDLRRADAAEAADGKVLVVVVLRHELGGGGVRQCEEIAGVKVIVYSSSLYYGNHDHFKTQVFSLVGLDPGLEKAAREKAKKRANVMGSGRQVGSAPSAQNCSPRDGDSPFAMNNPSFTAEGTSPQGQVGGALSACGSPPVAQAESGPPLQAIVLDCSGFNFMDSVGALSLIQVCEDFRDIGTRVLLARCSEEIQGTLEKSGFYKKFSEDVIFATLHDAVASITPTTTQRAALVSWHHEDVTVF